MSTNRITDVPTRRLADGNKAFAIKAFEIWNASCFIPG